MSWTTIKKSKTETVELEGTNNYLFTNKAKITVTGDEAGIVDVRGTTGFNRTVILNNDISVTIKRGSTADLYGIQSVKTNYSSVPSVTPCLTIRSADNATKLTVSLTTVVSSSTEICGICFEHTCGNTGLGTLYLGTARESFKKAISVSVTGSKGVACAYGVFSKNNLVFNAKLAATISVKSSVKSNTATAYGICAANTATISNGISAAILATASGTSGVANAVYGAKGIAISGNIAAKIGATATGTYNGASATGLSSAVGSITISGKIANSITAKATDKGGSANAYGIEGADSTVEINNIAAEISANATGKTATACAVSGDQSVTVTGISAGKVTATATASSTDATAYGFHSKSGSIEFQGKITKAIEAKATGKGDSVTAGGVVANINAIFTDIAADITSTASGSVYDTSSYAIRGGYRNNVTVNGNITGKITAKASGSTSGSATEYTSAGGIYNDSGSVIITGKVTKSITATVSGKNKDAAAYGIFANNAVNLGNVIGDVYASTNGVTSRTTAIHGGSSISVTGDFDGKITASAKSTTGSATAYGLYSDSSVSIDGDFNNTMSISATSKDDKALACAVYASTVSVNQSLGTVNVTATGEGSEDCAYGWYAENLLQAAGSELSGKATVTCKTGEACGLVVGAIQNLDGESNVIATLDITASGKKATGIQFTKECTLTLKDSKITGKTTNGGSAFALKDTNISEAGASQVITLERSTLTGDINMGGGDDVLYLTDQTKITGAVNLGLGNDYLELMDNSKIIGNLSMGSENKATNIAKIHSGSQVKGRIECTESLWLVLDDSDYKGTALWEGDIAQGSLVAGYTELTLDIDTAAIGTGTYALMKDTDEYRDWTGTSFKFYLDGSDSGVSLAFDGKSVTAADSPYDYKLTSDKSGKSLILAVTEKA